MGVLKKFELCVLGFIATTIVSFSGLFTVIGGAAKYEKMKAEVYEPIYQTVEYQEYYKRNISEYTQALADGKITKSRFNQLEKELDAYGYIKQLPENEKAYYEEKLKPAKDTRKKFNCAGLTLSCIGIAIGIADVVVAMIGVNE